MRLLGIILIAAGLLMFVFNGINFQTEKKVVDVGPLEVKKKENKHIGWPAYTGGIAIVAGLIVLTMSSRRRA